MIWRDEIKFHYNAKNKWFYARYSEDGIICEITFKEQYRRVMSARFFCYDVSFAIGNSIESCHFRMGHDNCAKIVTEMQGLKYLIWAYTAIQDFEKYALAMRGKRKHNEGIALTICSTNKKEMQVLDKVLSKLGYRKNHFDTRTIYGDKKIDHFLYKVLKNNGKSVVKL